MQDIGSGLQRVVGILLILMGMTLAIYGWIVPEARAEVTVMANVNLIWGIVMTFTGVLMAGFLWRS
jgi:hypothetical protein